MTDSMYSFNLPYSSSVVRDRGQSATLTECTVQEMKEPSRGDV